MAVTQAVYSVGTATTTVVAPNNDAAKYALKNIQPKNVDEYARDGYIYLIGQQFSIVAGGTAIFSLETGVTGAQLDFYTIITDTSSVLASLIEGSTITTTGNAIPAYNLNRNYSDAHTAVFKAATAATGGTVISQEFVTASIHGGGAMSSVKVHTLEPSSSYAMRFVNQGNQTTNVFFQVGFSEHYNGYNNIWLGTKDNSYVVRPGEELIMTLPPLSTINAVSAINSNKLSVMRLEE